MTSAVKVSIVVPVYNVEPYLARCIDSLLGQSMKEVQIILVDDGSDDNSGLICDQYACRYENIEVIHQDNQGLASARRSGLNTCVGEYVIFVDADDWIDSDMCKKEYEYIKRANAKILICDFNIVDGESVTRNQGYSGKNLTVSDFYMSITPGYVWNKMYHKSLIDIMKVDIDVSQAEDIAMLLPLVSKLKSDGDMIYIPQAFYNYCKRSGSSSDNSFFIDDYGIDEYLSSLRYALINSEKSRLKEISFYVMNCLSWGLNNRKRRYFKADYCEFFKNELYNYVLGNTLITTRFPKLLVELVGQCGRLIQRNLVYGNIESHDSELFRYCRDSWRARCRNYNIIEMNASNCNIQDAPDCVKKANEQKNYEFVNDYFCLEYLVRNGGIALAKNLFIHKPLGEIRYNGIFFSYIDDKEIGNAIYGMDKGSEFGITILGTYREQHIFNDSFLPLNRRFQFELEGNWGLIPKGISCALKNIINIYARNIMAEMLDDNCLAEILNDELYQAHKSGMVLIDRNEFLKISAGSRTDVADKSDTDHVNPDSQIIEEFKRREAELINEINIFKQAYENTISSTAWKITFPFRKVVNKLKKISQGKTYQEGEA